MLTKNTLRCRQNTETRGSKQLQMAALLHGVFLIVRESACWRIGPQHFTAAWKPARNVPKAVSIRQGLIRSTSWLVSDEHMRVYAKATVHPGQEKGSDKRHHVPATALTSAGCLGGACAAETSWPRTLGCMLARSGWDGRALLATFRVVRFRTRHVEAASAAQQQ